MLLSLYRADEKNRLIKTPSLYQADPVDYIEMPDGERAPVFDYKTFPFSIFKDCPVRTKRGKTLDRISYLDIVATYDIETTTILADDPFAFMYHWQFCIEDYVFFGRTWEQFIEFTDILKNTLDLHISTDGEQITGRSLVIYVFNLSFEFEFTSRFMGELINPMFTDKYAPLIIPTKKGFTYRCAYRLTNSNLDTFTKNCKHHKLKGDLDYTKIRTPKTPLTNLEKAYCYNDVKGLAEALRYRFDTDTKYNMATIPLTSTGYVRNDARYSMGKNPKNHYKFIDTKLDAHLYKLCRLAFRGGNTHANAAHVGKHLHNVKSWDITSSYPAWILTKTYPIGPFEKIEDTSNLLRDFNKIVKTHCLLVTVRLYNIKYIGSCGVPYISRDKALIRVMDETQVIEDNGRVTEAPFIQLTLTDIDLALTLKDYSYSKLEIVEAYRSIRGKLPKELRNVCYEYYKQKTQLKGLEDADSKYTYNRQKALLNSCYGMLVQRLDRIEYHYINNEYVPFKKPLDAQLDEFYNKRSSFLSYQHGCWVCAWARLALHLGCEIAGADLVYIDTDSVKYIGNHEEQFKKLNIMLRKNAEQNGAVAYNKDGEPFYIGVYDQEKTYTDFKTLRSKCYIYSYDNGKTIQSTISGVSKEVGAAFFTEHGFDALHDGQKIPVSGKLMPRYNNEDPHYIEIEGVKILTASNIALVPADYTIKIDKAHRLYVERVQKQLYNLKHKTT